MDRVVFTNETDLWRTERDLVRWLQRRYGPFTLDAAASDATIAPAYYGPGSVNGEDALTQPWHGAVYCNPPYSRVAAFVAKAVYEMSETPTCDAITFLVGVRSDTAWWQDSFGHWTEIALLRSRTRFWLTPAELEAINAARAAEGKKPISDQNTAPFPSAVLHWSRARSRSAFDPHVLCRDWRAELAASDREAVA